MARIDWVDARLREWAAWLSVGDGNGYAAMNPLHKDWMPPTPGTTPTLKVARHSNARATHSALCYALSTGALSERLADTLVLHYCYALPVAEQAARLGCRPTTVDERIRVAHARLAALL